MILETIKVSNLIHNVNSSSQLGFGANTFLEGLCYKLDILDLTDVGLNHSEKIYQSY